jgi:hypothetical protein
MATKRKQNRPNGRKMYQHLSLQDTPKFTQIGIFVFIWQPSHQHERHASGADTVDRELIGGYEF